MNANSIDGLALRLAHNRQTGTVSGLPLDALNSHAEAAAVQSAALDAFAEDFTGYSLVGTSELALRSLGLRRPIYTPLPHHVIHPDGWHLHLPEGMIGAQCELAFTLGRAFPEGGEPIDRLSASIAILACQPTIGLLGRRARADGPGELLAIADFALHVATICGPIAEGADTDTLDRSVMTASIDGDTVVTASAGSILGHPVEAIVWLAQQLLRENRQLTAGDVVVTGSCAPFLQVLPGQELTVEFEGIGAVSCRFD